MSPQSLQLLIYFLISFERRTLIYLIKWFRFLGPSIQDEQREKQLSPLEAVGQILKRSVYTRVSPVIENSDVTKPRAKSHDKSPPSYKVDPFVNHLNPFSIFDKIKVHIYELYSKIPLVLQFNLRISWKLLIFNILIIFEAGIRHNFSVTISCVAGCACFGNRLVCCQAGNVWPGPGCCGIHHN